MADHSVDGTVIDVPFGQFVKQFVGPEETETTMTLERWIRENDPDPTRDLLLQMDIEGAEYPTLGAASEELLRRFRIIVIELHYLPAILSRPPFVKRAKPMIDRMAHRRLSAPEQCFGQCRA